ncbi:hypothetical protein D3Z36_13805 [Lachnospiraceae bacterium]|nr:hypothetical protein [Lachnospiraceae bacterium]
MLFSTEQTKQIDYLADWPAHYYEIPTGAARKKALDDITKQGLDVPADSIRRHFCELRFFSKNKAGTIDTFMHAWMMIKSSSAAGVSFLKKKRLMRELETYMEELCLLPSTLFSQEEQQILTDEWRDFSHSFLASCTGSKAYCSTLFGFVPIKDATIAQKIAEEILLVTRDYPANFGLSEEFAPFRQIMCDTYCQTIAQGEQYLLSCHTKT